MNFILNRLFILHNFYKVQYVIFHLICTEFNLDSEKQTWPNSSRTFYEISLLFNFFWLFFGFIDISNIRALPI